jgi:homoserine dehydrogenase
MPTTVKAKNIRVGLLGLGTVGAGVVEILQRHGDQIAARTGLRLQIVRALVKSTRRKRRGSAAKISLTSKVERIVEADDIDVVAELMGGIDTPLDYITRALKASKPVVTANKAVIAGHGPELFRIADRMKRDLCFEAAVAGGIPIIRTIREGLASDRINEIVGILNGTTNYILDAMTQGRSYDKALKEAQTLGFAEADPSLDVSGRDAADKIAILAYLAFGTRIRPDQVRCEGITELNQDIIADAARLGYRVKLLGVARREEQGEKSAQGLDVRVHPAFIPEEHVMGHVPGAQNAIAIASDALGPTLYQGAGAGALPTGNSVVADLIAVGRNLRAGINTCLHEGRLIGVPKPLAWGHSLSAYYLRVGVTEQPGVLASITHILARSGVSLATVNQKGQATQDHVSIALTTYPATAKSMLRAVKAMKHLPSVVSNPQVVRIEEIITAK